MVGYRFGAKTRPLPFDRLSPLVSRRENLMAKAFHETTVARPAPWPSSCPSSARIPPSWLVQSAWTDYGRSLEFTLLGGAVWAIWIALLGYSLGSSFRAFEGVDHYSTTLVLAFLFPGLVIYGPSVVREPREIVSWVGACLARRRLPDT